MIKRRQQHEPRRFVVIYEGQANTQLYCDVCKRRMWKPNGELQRVFALCDGLQARLVAREWPGEYRDGLSGFFWGIGCNDDFWPDKDEIEAREAWREQYKSDRPSPQIKHWKGARSCDICRREYSYLHGRRWYRYCDLCWRSWDDWRTRRQAREKEWERPIIKTKIRIRQFLDRLIEDASLLDWERKEDRYVVNWLFNNLDYNYLPYRLRESDDLFEHHLRESDYQVAKQKITEWLVWKLATEPKAQQAFAMLLALMLKQEAKRKTDNNETRKRPRTRAEAIKYYSLVISELRRFDSEARPGRDQPEASACESASSG